MLRRQVLGLLKCCHLQGALTEQLLGSCQLNEHSHAELGAPVRLYKYQLLTSRTYHVSAHNQMGAFNGDAPILGRCTVACMS